MNFDVCSSGMLTYSQSDLYGKIKSDMTSYMYYSFLVWIFNYKSLVLYKIGIHKYNLYQKHFPLKIVKLDHKETAIIQPFPLFGSYL